jgi:2-amino-4-hydroxy-6-hydroxymethyldihydropteridine diphosphokinase
MNKVYIQLGSNLGDREGYLKQSQVMLIDEIGLIIKKSRIYESSPWGVENQGSFLNQVLLLETDVKPFDLLDRILNIEKEMGRVRIEKWGERIIDIDILFYNDEIIETNNLCIPHPYISKRRFVLSPLDEIAKNYIHPILQKTINKLLSECLDEEKVSVYEL